MFMGNTNNGTLFLSSCWLLADNENNKYCIPKRAKISKLLLEKQLGDHLYWKYRASIKMRFRENLWEKFIWTKLNYEPYYPQDYMGCVFFFLVKRGLTCSLASKGHNSQIFDSNLQNPKSEMGSEYWSEGQVVGLRLVYWGRRWMIDQLGDLVPF